ncbi:MAG: LysR family transcriptional regulator [Rhodospirillales bacterium]
MADMNYHHLRYFYVVAHEGHLTRAADRLNVSQSALSSQIRKLEERLGHALFERRGRSLHLTEAGRIALDHADSIFATGEELLSILSKEVQIRRPLRVGAVSTLSRNFQLSFLQPILGQDDVEVVLRSASRSELYEALSSLQLDVILSNHAPDTGDTSSYIVHRIAEQPVGLIGVPGLCKKEMPLSERLNTAPLILPAAPSSLRTAFDGLVSKRRITPKIAAEIDDMAMARLLTREGIGLAVIPPIVVKDELQTGMLQMVERLPGINETFFAIERKREYPNPLLRKLLADEPSSAWHHESR